MRWTRKTIAIAVTGAAFLLGGGAAAAGALTSSSSPSVILAAPAAKASPVTPTPTKTVTAPPSPVPTKTVTAPPAPEQTPAWQQPSAPAGPGSAAVQQLHRGRQPVLPGHHRPQLLRRVGPGWQQPVRRRRL